MPFSFELFTVFAFVSWYVIALTSSFFPSFPYVLSIPNWNQEDLQVAFVVQGVTHLKVQDDCALNAFSIFFVCWFIEYWEVQWCYQGYRTTF